MSDQFKTRKEIDAEIARLTKLRDSLPELKLWKPIKGQPYYWINAFGRVVEGIWSGEALDEAYQQFGNCNATEDSAKRRAAKIYVENIMWQFADDGLFQIFVDTNEDGSLRVYGDCFSEEWSRNQPRYSTEERAQAVIEFIGQDAFERAYGKGEKK